MIARAKELEVEVEKATADPATMLGSRGRKTKSDDSFLLNILPSEVAEELKAKGSTDAKLIDEVTVLFTDFKDFTRLSESLSPKELVAEINVCFSTFDLALWKKKKKKKIPALKKSKPVRDAYMAAGGLPTPNLTHAADVVNAVNLEIQQWQERNNKGRHQENWFLKSGLVSTLAR